MPLLIAAAVALWYVVLEKRVLKDRGVETEAFQSLSENVTALEALARGMDGRLEEMARQQEVLKQSMDEKEAPMTEAFMVFEKTSASLRKELRSVNQHLKNVDEQLGRLDGELKRIDGVKADASEVAAAEKTLEAFRKTELAALDEKLDALGSSFESVEADARDVLKSAADLEEAHARDRDATAQAVEGARAELAGLSADYKQLKKDLVDVLSVTIDQKGLNQAIRNQEKRYRGEIRGLTRSLEAKDRAISLLQTELKSLERRVTALARNRRPLGTPKPGSFIEQNIE
jgi:chromosome segregation ATPase